MVCRFPPWAQVTFFGPRSEYVASGSDCGHIFLWDKVCKRRKHSLERGPGGGGGGQGRAGGEGGVLNLFMHGRGEMAVDPHIRTGEWEGGGRLKRWMEKGGSSKEHGAGRCNGHIVHGVVHRTVDPRIHVQCRDRAR